MLKKRITVPEKKWWFEEYDALLFAIFRHNFLSLNAKKSKFLI